MRKTILPICAIATMTLTANYALAFEKPCPQNKDEPRHERKGPPKHMKDFFKDIDLNSDKEITKTEFVQHSEKMFLKIDKNKDGVLTKEEVKSHHEEMRGNFKNKR
jgi:hypothetical protein